MEDALGGRVRALLDPVRPGHGGRRLPFALVTVVALAGAALPGSRLVLPYLLGGLGALGLSVLAVCWPRSPRSNRLELVGALWYLAFIALLVQAQGGSVKSGSYTLALMPILWVALYNRPRDSAVIVMASGAVQVWLSLIIGQPGVLVARKAFLWLLIAGGISMAVHQLRRRFLRAIEQRDATARRAEALAAAVQELAVLRDPDRVLREATRVAAELVPVGDVGLRRATYFSVDAGRVQVLAEHDESGHEVRETWDLSEHPMMARAVATQSVVTSRMDVPEIGESVRRAAEAAGITHAAWVPVAHRGQVHGVLSVASRGGPVEGNLLSLVASLGHVLELAMENALAHVELDRQAGLDALTGCANRRGLTAADPGRSSRFAVLVADLDGLKTINDLRGHEAGDAALVRFAQLLRSAVRPGDVVARTGGDEFVVVLADASLEVARPVAERILAALASSPERHLRASIGICASSGQPSLETVIVRADQAMYRAKRGGGMRVAEWQDPAVPVPLPA